MISLRHFTLMQVMEKASKFFYPKNRSGNVEIDTENLTNLFINSSRKELTYKIRRGIYWGAIMGTLALAADHYEEKTVTALFSISAGLSGLSSIGQDIISMALETGNL